MRTKKMTKDIKYVIEEVNKQLRNSILLKSYKVSIFSFACHLLMDKGMYHGFNYYLYDTNGNLKLAGKETDIVQLYVV